MKVQELVKGVSVNKLTKPEADIEELVSHIGIGAGVKAPVAKILAVVFSEPKDLSLDEIKAATGYSLALVSTVVKQLEMMGKITRVKIPGSKKVYVRFNRNLIESMRDQFHKSMSLLVKPMKQRVPHIIEDLKKESKKSNHSEEKRKQLKDKASWLTCYLEQLKTLQAIFKDFETSLQKHERKYR